MCVRTKWIFLLSPLSSHTAECVLCVVAFFLCVVCVVCVDDAMIVDIFSLQPVALAVCLSPALRLKSGSLPHFCRSENVPVVSSSPNRYHTLFCDAGVRLYAEGQLRRQTNAPK